MTDVATRASALLKEPRERIDRLDAILVYTLAERFKHTKAVGRLKAEHDLPPSDPARESRQIEPRNRPEKSVIHHRTRAPALIPAIISPTAARLVRSTTDMPRHNQRVCGAENPPFPPPPALRS